MLNHLLKVPQKTEPKSVLWFRRIVIISALVILISAFALLCVRVFNEVPTISTTIKTGDKILAPVNATSCDDHIIQPTFGKDIDFPFTGSFSPKFDIALTKFNDTGPFFVYLHMFVNTTGLLFNDTAQDSTFRMVAFDADSTSLFEDSLFYKNKYLLARNTQNVFLYNRKIRKELDKRQQYLSIIGFLPKYDETLNYIESNIETLPMQNSSDQLYTSVRINPRDFTITEEREQRQNTIVGALGTVVAFYGCFVFIYVSLFGVDSIRPWGIVHNFCGIREKTQEKLIKNMQLSNTDDLESLIQTVNELEIFYNYLRLNVIDSSLFASIQQKQE
ncbi:17195_t:CDS:2 [Dentiscutata erythropus]|uniref:17195_t:CDS:1 n=1 Tax=Dentiscutata erythropus TaxID=1348616 RepID=A0A9N9JDQ3_9GLOM|nr:17195_t:CDS:2 [Dentiscutata erythropus]